MKSTTNHYESYLIRPIPAAVMTAAAAACLALLVTLEQWVYAAVAVGMLLVLLYPIEIALGLYAFMIPFDSVRFFSGQQSGTSLTSVAGIGAAVVLLGTGLLQRRIQRPPLIALWFTLLLGWATLSTLWTVNSVSTSERLPTSFALLMFYLAAASLRIREQELARVTEWAIAGGVAASLVSIYQFFITGGIESRSTLVVEASYTDPNFFAATLLLPLSLAIAGYLSKQGRLQKAAMLGGAAVIALAVFFSMSRGAVLALFVMTLIFAVRLRMGRRVLAPISAVFVVALLAPQLFFVRLQQAIASRGTGRVDIWIAGLHSLKEFGLAGAGLNNFPLAYEAYAGYAPLFRGYRRAAHNIYLSTWVELGIVGIVLLLIACGSHLRALRFERIRTDIVALEAACWGTLTAAFFLDLMWRKSFWFVWVLVAITAQQVRARQAAQPQVTPLNARMAMGRRRPTL